MTSSYIPVLGEMISWKLFVKKYMHQTMYLFMFTLVRP